MAEKTEDPLKGAGTLTAIALAAVAVSFAAAPASAAETVNLVPHKVEYDMRLGRVRSGGDISQASGLMTMEWVKSCEGWAVKQRVRLRLTNNEGNSIDTDSNFSSFESLDGLSYRFTARTTRNGRLTEDLQGTAHLNAKGGAGGADFTRPDDVRFDLPKGTLFPTEHVIQLIREARKGERVIHRIVFDGATKDGPLEVNAFVTRHLAKAPARWAKNRLTDQPSWHLRLAFFPLASSKAEPDYELGLQLFDNGVADDFELDYGTFTVDATLRKIEALPRPKC